MSKSTKDGKSVQTGFKMGCTQFHTPAYSLSLRCSAIGSCSPCTILFIASIFIFSYMPSSNNYQSHRLAFHFLASEVVYCLAFCLQSPKLNNLYCYKLGFYFAKELNCSPLQGSHTVEQDIIKILVSRLGF